MDTRLQEIESISNELFSGIAKLSTVSGPASLHATLIASIRGLLSSLDRELECARSFVEQEAEEAEEIELREDRKLMIRKYSEDLKTHRILYRKAVLSAKHNLVNYRLEMAKASAALRMAEVEASGRERESAEGAIGGGGSRDGGGGGGGGRSDSRSGRKRKRRDENASNAVLQSSSEVTAELRRTHSLLSEELYKSAYSQELLQQSTETLRRLEEEYSFFGSVLTTSKKVMKELESADRVDRLYIYGSLAFCASAISWVIYRRLFSRPVNMLIWSGSFMFNKIARGRVIEHSLHEASNKRRKGDQAKADIVDLSIPQVSVDGDDDDDEDQGRQRLIRNARVNQVPEPDIILPDLHHTQSDGDDATRAQQEDKEQGNLIHAEL